MPFWYDVEGRKVIEHEEKGHDWQLMGPYPTREAAEHALQTAAERTAKWDAEDKAWNDKG